MKFLFDNNLPPALARAINCLLEPEGHECHALRDKFEQDADDIDWIEVLGGEGDWVVVSQDHFNKRGGLEKEAIRRAGLTVFCLKSAWNSHTYWDKAYNMVRWMPRIQAQAEGISGAAAFRVSWKYGAKGKFEQFTL